MQPFLKSWTDISVTTEHPPRRSPNSAESDSRRGISPRSSGESTRFALPRTEAQAGRLPHLTGDALHAPH